MKETDTANAGISGSGQSGAGLRCVLAACRFGIKTLGIVKPGCFFVRTENVYGRRTCTSGERVRVENGYGRRTGIMKAGEG